MKDATEMCTKWKIKLLLLIVFHTLYLSLRFTLYILYMYSLRSVFALPQNFMGPCLKLIIYFISFLNLVNNPRVKQDLQWKKETSTQLTFPPGCGLCEATRR